MKTAIYIEDGIVQLVLTPQNDFEKDALAGFQDGEINAKIMRGSFYDCRGGWVRQSDIGNMVHGWGEKSNDNSLIIRHSNKTIEPTET